MTTDRCPGCAAAITPGAPWCTLCYADLRVPVPAASIAEYGASSVDIAQFPAAPESLPPDPILDAPVDRAAPIARVQTAGWPCLGCGATVPMADDACPDCGRPFLPADDMPSLALPVVGDLVRLDRGQRIAVTAVVALLAVGLFVALAFIGGSIF